jgi:hypothetical protein
MQLFAVLFAWTYFDARAASSAGFEHLELILAGNAGVTVCVAMFGIINLIESFVSFIGSKQLETRTCN